MNPQNSVYISFDLGTQYQAILIRYFDHRPTEQHCKGGFVTNIIDASSTKNKVKVISKRKQPSSIVIHLNEKDQEFNYYSEQVKISDFANINHEEKLLIQKPDGSPFQQFIFQNFKQVLYRPIDGWNPEKIQLQDDQDISSSKKNWDTNDGVMINKTIIMRLSLLYQISYYSMFNATMPLLEQQTEGKYNRFSINLCVPAQSTSAVNQWLVQQVMTAYARFSKEYKGNISVPDLQEKDVFFKSEPICGAYSAMNTLKDGDKILVFDIGAGTTDLQAFGYSIDGVSSQVTFLGQGVKNVVGGADIDKKIEDVIYQSVTSTNYSCIAEAFKLSALNIDNRQNMFNANSGMMTQMFDCDALNKVFEFAKADKDQVKKFINILGMLKNTSENPQFSDYFQIEYDGNELTKDDIKRFRGNPLSFSYDLLNLDLLPKLFIDAFRFALNLIFNQSFVDNFNKLIQEHSISSILCIGGWFENKVMSEETVAKIQSCCGLSSISVVDCPSIAVIQGSNNTVVERITREIIEQLPSDEFMEVISFIPGQQSPSNDRSSKLDPVLLAYQEQKALIQTDQVANFVMNLNPGDSRDSKLNPILDAFKEQLQANQTENSTATKFKKECRSMNFTSAIEFRELCHPSHEKLSYRQYMKSETDQTDGKSYFTNLVRPFIYKGEMISNNDKKTFHFGFTIGTNGMQQQLKMRILNFNCDKLTMDQCPVSNAPGNPGILNKQITVYIKIIEQLILLNDYVNKLRNKFYPDQVVPDLASIQRKIQSNIDCKAQIAKEILLKTTMRVFTSFSFCQEILIPDDGTTQTGDIVFALKYEGEMNIAQFIQSTSYQDEISFFNDNLTEEEQKPFQYLLDILKGKQVRQLGVTKVIVEDFNDKYWKV